MENQKLVEIAARRRYAMLRVMPDGEQFPSPIYVFETRALKAGKGILELRFWNPIYPGGQGHGLNAPSVLSD